MINWPYLGPWAGVLNGGEDVERVHVLRQPWRAEVLPHVAEGARRPALLTQALPGRTTAVIARQKTSAFDASDQMQEVSFIMPGNFFTTHPS